MKYSFKVHFAEDWLFLSRVFIHKLEKVRGAWGQTKCEKLEMKIIYLVLTGFQQVSDVPQWKEYRELKETQTYRKDSNGKINGLETGVEDRLNLLDDDDEPIFPEDRKHKNNKNIKLTQLYY